MTDSKETVEQAAAMRASQRDLARADGYEPEALEDDDILSRGDIEERQRNVQHLRGDREGPSDLHGELAPYEVIASRSEIVCTAENLLLLLDRAEAAEAENAKLRELLRRALPACQLAGVSGEYDHDLVLEMQEFLGDES